MLKAPPLPKTPYNHLKVVIIDDEVPYRMALRRLVEKELR
jgi:hypothetical protein